MSLQAVILLTGTTAVDGGPPFDISEAQVPFSIDIKGIVAGDTVTIFVSNDALAPANSAAMRAYAAAVTTNSVVKITEGYRWIVVNRTAIAGGGTVTATAAFSNRK